METNKSIENFNDLIFENKHKEYGAYALRKSHNDNVTLALFVTSLFFGGLALTAAFYMGGKKMPDMNGNIPPDDTMQVYIFNIPPLDKLPVEEDIKPKEKEIPKSDNANYKAVDEKVETEAKVNELLVIKKDGIEKGVDSVAPTDIPEEYTLKGSPSESGDPEHYVDEMPEFNGDIRKFIIDHLEYPRGAVYNHTVGTVGLSFVVEKDGSIGAIKILNAVEDGCTEEAIRVLKLMPKWKPGKNHGELVRVWYNIPIKFSLK